MSVHALPTPDRFDGATRAVADEDVVDAWLRELAGTYSSTLLDRLLDRAEVTGPVEPAVATFAAHLRLHELNAAIGTAPVVSSGRR